MHQNYVQEEIKEQTKVKECLLSFGAESAIRKYKIEDI
jgi:hypothetical protein